MKIITKSIIFCFGIFTAPFFNRVEAFGVVQLPQPRPISSPPSPSRGIDSTIIQTSRPQLHTSSHSSTLLDYVILWTLAPETSVASQGIATRDQVQEALRNPQTVLLDARTDEEIIRDGFLSVRGHRWVHASCTMEDCPLLVKTAESQLPNKNVPVLAYCGTGKRAAQAVKTLKSKGYLHVLNAGAYPDLDYLKALP